MTSSLIEMMLLKEMMGDRNNDFTKKYDEFQLWLKERDNKAKATKPPTFSPGQVFLIILGLGPAMGMGALIAYAQLGQYLLDAIRQLH